MTWHYWKYAELLKKTAIAGSIYIDLTTGKQQLMKPLVGVIKAVTGDNSGGTSESNIHLGMATTGTNAYFVNPSVAGTIILPNKDYLGKFKTLNFNDFILGDGDKIQFLRSYIAVNGTIIIEIRAMVSNYAKPNIKISSDVTSENLYHDEIVGTIE